jgi:uncharacterized protein (TIGR02996 family)
VNPFIHPDWRAFSRAIAARPGDHLPQLIAADWMRDHGATEAQVGELWEPLTVTDRLPADCFGHGIGSGIGGGRGGGRGSGSGRGRGSGGGRGRGSGSGRGRGSGRGSGSGIGSGIGSGRGRGTEMEPAKNYLILTVDWYAWVGRCVRQVGPYEYEFEQVSKFDTNAGDVFGEIAAGDETLRRGCTYQHFQGKALLGLGRVGVFEWVGKLPQEYAGPAQRRNREG